MNQEREEALTLEILQAIEARSDVTQRHLAERAGVALGLANSYLRRCVRKGLVKIKQAPANRYLYYLTPKGFAEKSRLTTAYLAYSFDFYRRASASISESLRECCELHYQTILFAGASELAEIGSVRMHDFGLSCVGTYDPGGDARRFIGLPVWARLEDVAASDAVVFSAVAAAPGMYQALREHFGDERVIVPSIVASLALDNPAPTER